jgi:hypothetical protein
MKKIKNIYENLYFDELLIKRIYKFFTTFRPTKIPRKHMFGVGNNFGKSFNLTTN